MKEREKQRLLIIFAFIGIFVAFMTYSEIVLFRYDTLTTIGKILSLTMVVVTGNGLKTLFSILRSWKRDAEGI